MKDPTGLGALDWLLDLFKEKAPEESINKAVGSGLAALCITRNCGKKRDRLDLYGDCLHFLDDWIKKQGPEVIAAVSSVTADGGQAAVSECSKLCEEGIRRDSCCKGGKE